MTLGWAVLYIISVVFVNWSNVLFDEIILLDFIEGMTSLMVAFLAWSFDQPVIDDVTGDWPFHNFPSDDSGHSY